MKTNGTYWVLTVTVFLGLLIPPLVQNGMFLDGITYSAIAKNMANGIGSFWNPHYTKILYPNFHEHPPLVFIIQSFFFKVLGDGIYTERFFCLITAILSAVGIVLCWRLFNKKSGLQNYSWALICLWITTPLIFWSYSNNLLENTLGVFTLFSVYFISKSLLESKIIYLVLASILLVMAFLSKGPVGLFPIVVPLCFGLVFQFKKPTKAISYFIYLVVSTVFIVYLLSIVFPESKENILSYFEQQLIPALNNKREITTNNRFSIIGNLIIKLAFPLILLVYVGINKWRKTKSLNFLHHKEFLFFLLIAISASFPLIISFKQRAYYLVPSIPFYILSISFLIVPHLKETITSLSSSTHKRVRRLSYLALAFIISFSIFRFGKYSRDEEKLKTIYAISEVVPNGTIISTTKTIWEDWSMVAYMNRIGYLSLDCDHEHDFFLIKKNDIIEPHTIKKYNKVSVNLMNYMLLKKKKPEQKSL